MKRSLALAALAALSACEKAKSIDASVGAPVVSGPPTPPLEEVTLDQNRVRPCRFRKLPGLGPNLNAECAEEWAANQPKLKDYNPNPRWQCMKDERVHFVFEPRPRHDLPLVEISLDQKLLTLIRERDRDARSGRPTDCVDVVDLKPAPAPPYVEPRLVGPPPSVADAVRAAEKMIESQSPYYPVSGGLKAAGTCALPEPTMGCEGLRNDRVVLFSMPAKEGRPAMTFFVRVDAALNARFDEPFPDYSAAKPTSWIACKCEAQPGFHVTAGPP